MIDRAIGLLMASGWRRGVRGGNQVWIVVGLAAWLLNRVRSQRQPTKVYLEDLGPGEALVITHHPPPVR